MYKIILLSEAKKFYKRLFISNRKLFNRIDNALESLKANPFLGKPLKDKLKGRYSLRVGVYRIIYSVEKQEATIYVLDIGHRREIYR
ncbi:MAG: type II toxin-antitoxin system RelE/ParE family toxin [Candidatus Omnitrophota bacterium]|nr:type II toxin-antitoxin system RelE/ParE family toxin [Candidatus Omnitrophota bacterium]